MALETQTDDLTFTVVPVQGLDDEMQLVNAEGIVEAIGSMEFVIDTAFELANGLTVPW